MDRTRARPHPPLSLYSLHTISHVSYTCSNNTNNTHREDETIRLWDLSTRGRGGAHAAPSSSSPQASQASFQRYPEAVGLLRHQTEPIMRVNWSPDGTLLASGCRYKSKGDNHTGFTNSPFFFLCPINRPYQTQIYIYKLIHSQWRYGLYLTASNSTDGGRGRGRGDG